MYGCLIPHYPLNIEGKSRAKTDYLTKVLSIHKIDMILFEETNASNEDHLQARGHIPGFTLAVATYDHRYGLATYARETIIDWKPDWKFVEHDISTLSTKVAGINIQNIYKPPNVKWSIYTHVTLEHLTVYMGDFNSHHQSWEYFDNDENGEIIYE